MEAESKQRWGWGLLRADLLVLLLRGPGLFGVLFQKSANPLVDSSNLSGATKVSLPDLRLTVEIH